MVIIIKLYRRV